MNSGKSLDLPKDYSKFCSATMRARLAHVKVNVVAKPELRLDVQPLHFSVLNVKDESCLKQHDYSNTVITDKEVER